MVKREDDAYWISCDKGYPEKLTDCLVTREGSFLTFVDMAVYEGDGKWSTEDWKQIVIADEEEIPNCTKIISTKEAGIKAWMPLPKPYKTEIDNMPYKE